MPEPGDIVVIGAGPAGIAAGLALGERAVVLERGDRAGGLSRTVELAGAVFDIGGHSFHSPHPAVRELVFGAVDMFEQRRDARCFACRTLIPYPFQKHFRALPDPQVVAECAGGLAGVDGAAGAAHFEEHIERRFGPGIARHFMLPYNRKLWGRDLKRLSADWTGERVAAPEGTREKFDTAGGKRKPLQDDTRVAYPARGGFGEIYGALGARLADLRLGAEVTAIDAARRRVTVNGAELPYRHLVSTLPLPVLLELLGDAPAEIAREVGELDFLSMKVVMVAIGHPVDTAVQRIYSADPHIAAHKIAINHNSSDWLRARPHHGVMAEISYSADKPLARADVEAWVVENLIELGIVRGAGEVAATRAVDVRYAYPVPTHGRDAAVGRARAWLRERDIHVLGRFGEWAYVNSDECLHRGLVLGEALRDA